jgi:hypothetical protein
VLARSAIENSIEKVGLNNSHFTFARQCTARA